MRGARRSAVGSWSRMPLAAQVPVEGAQAGRLALERRRRHGRALVAAGGELGEEAGEVGVLHVEHVDTRRVRNAPNCRRSER